MSLDLATRARKQAAERELREIKRAEKSARPARPKAERKVVGTGPGEATERKAIPVWWRLEVRGRQDHRCAKCGKSFMSGLPIEYDHVLPLALGGEHSAANLEALCTSCHKDKTKLDVKRIAKAKRQAKMMAPRDPNKRSAFSRFSPSPVTRRGR